MNTRVETQYGWLEGREHPTHLAYLGIRYAQPPLNALRFAPPAPPDSWSGVRDATQLGAASLQGTPFAMGMSAEGPESEDCLFLNVFTRALGERKRPVLFWIHGGAYTVGSAGGPLYDGQPLVDLGDVVVVSHNYRLGALGFLDLGDAGERIGALPNLAILDHIAALSWVRTNIERFGGDPNNVTLFGESAGASSVAALLVAPKARGLFQRSIAQSPALHRRFAARERADETRARLFAKLELRDGQVEQLRTLPAQQILAAQRAIELEGLGWRAFFPVQHADSLPRDPELAFADPAQPKLPLIVGANRDEWNLFDAMNIARWEQPIERSEVAQKLATLLGPTHAERGEALLETYRHSRTALALPHTDRALLRAIEGDLRFRMAAVRLAELHVGASIPVYAYLFMYQSPGLKGALRACHALDLPFVFGTYRAPLQDRFAGTGPAVARLSDIMMRTWLSFAEHAAPDYLTDFRGYDLRERPTMLFDVECKLALDPLGEERAAWDGIV